MGRIVDPVDLEQVELGQPPLPTIRQRGDGETCGPAGHALQGQALHADGQTLVTVAQLAMDVAQPGRRGPDARGAIDERDGLLVTPGAARGVGGLDQLLSFVTQRAGPLLDDFMLRLDPGQSSQKVTRFAEIRPRSGRGAISLSTTSPKRLWSCG